MKIIIENTHVKNLKDVRTEDGWHIAITYEGAIDDSGHNISDRSELGYWYKLGHRPVHSKRSCCVCSN